MQPLKCTHLHCYWCVSNSQQKLKKKKAKKTQIEPVEVSVNIQECSARQEDARSYFAFFDKSFLNLHSSDKNIWK